MGMNNLSETTQDELMTAFEICCLRPDVKCSSCPFYGDDREDDCDNLEKNIAGLIYDKDMEISALESKIFALNDTNKMLMESQDIYWKNKLGEFIVRLKNRSVSPLIDSRNEHSVSMSDVDEIAKEMLGLEDFSNMFANVEKLEPLPDTKTSKLSLTDRELKKIRKWILKYYVRRARKRKRK